LWEATHHFIAGSISSFIVFSFIAFKKIKNTKIFWLKQPEEQKISSPILGKNVTRFGKDVTRFCPTSEASQKNF